jgi:hypothetical protein
LPPDGRQIAFVRANSRDQKSYRFVAGADGSGEGILAQADARKMIFADSPSWSPDGKRIAVAAGNIGDEVYSSLLRGGHVGQEQRLRSRPRVGTGRVCWLADGCGLIYTGMPGLNERWQIFHISYPDGVVSPITKDLDSYGSVQLTHFNAEEILSIAFTADGRLFASRGHTTSEVLLTRNFQARN